MMQYSLSHYTDPLSWVLRFCLNSMISFQASVAVIFTGIFATKMLQLFNVSLYIQNAVFLPCACYFLWAFCISLIDMNIERDVL